MEKHTKGTAFVIPMDVEQLKMRVAILEQQVKALTEIIAEHEVFFQEEFDGTRKRKGNVDC